MCICTCISVPSTDTCSKQIYEKNVINVQMYMYVMIDYATHTYTICNLKQYNNRPHIIDCHYCLHLPTCKHLSACNLLFNMLIHTRGQ